jgi:steroid 5-alpha reductase family enzyme
VDVFWGPGFLVVAWVARTVAPDPGGLSLLTVILVGLWSLRLAGHLLLRARGRGEDTRYAAMRAEHGDTFPLRSLVTVFGLQGLLIWLLGLPLALAASSPESPGPVAWMGAGLVGVGLVLESVADHQLSRFRRQQGEGVLDTGLWRYSRHPNYFGEAVLWWGFWLLAVDAGAAWTVFAPAGVTLLLLKVSGVPLLEAQLRARRPGYAAYVRRTSAFVPWPPRKDP